MRITVMLSLVIGACLSSLMFVYGDGHDYDHNYHHHSSSSSYCNRDSDCTGCHSYQSGHCSNNHCTCIDAKTHCEVDADCLNLCPKETPFQHCRHYNFLLLYWTDCDCKACFEDTDCTCTGETMPHCSHSQGGSACHCLSTIAPTTEPPPTTPTTTTATTTIPSTTETTTTTATTTIPSTTETTTTIRTSTAAPTTETTSAAPLPTTCRSGADCTGHICPLQSQRYPHCKFNGYSSTCQCTVCMDNNHCFCPSGLIGQCHHGHTHNCVCALPTVPTTDSTTTRPPTTERLSTVGLSTVASTTIATSAALPLSTACRSDADCTGHICPLQSQQYPHCKFNGYSSTCQCTVCLDNSHCFCPPGMIGQCQHGHTHSCVCVLPTVPTTESTSTSAATTTVPSSTTKLSTLSHAATRPTTSTASSTTAKSTIPSSTMSSSTSAPQAVSSSGTRKCHVCGDDKNNITCDMTSIYMGSLQTCASGKDFCMTDIVHNGYQYPYTYKRCVTEQECRNKWLHQTSDQEYCMNYGGGPMTGLYSCHFCCVSDGCNSNQIPDKSTFYVKP